MNAPSISTRNNIVVSDQLRLDPSIRLRVLVDQLIIGGEECARANALALEGLLRDIRFNAPDAMEPIRRNGMLASSTAAHCLTDSLRSHRFASAIRGELAKLLERHPERPVKVLDAGCGPYAFLSLVAACQSERVEVAALEINPASVTQARYLIEALGFGDQITVNEADCTAVRMTDNPDLIVTETFDSGLFREFGVQIMTNLAAQASPDTITLPATVWMDLNIFRRSEGSDPQRVFQTRIFEYASPERAPRFSGSEIDYTCFRPGLYSMALSTGLALNDSISLQPGANCAISTRTEICTLKVLDSISSMSIQVHPGEERFSLSVEPRETIELLYRPTRGSFSCEING